jgi:hypothetical protein
LPHRDAIERALKSIERRRKQQSDIGNYLQMLAYPLHTGATWIRSGEYDVPYRVEAHEVLEMPFGMVPAWRIRVEEPSLEPGEEVRIWASRAGFLKSAEHYEGLMYVGSTVVGTVSMDVLYLLDDVELAESVASAAR